MASRKTLVVKSTNSFGDTFNVRLTKEWAVMTRRYNPFRVKRADLKSAFKAKSWLKSVQLYKMVQGEMYGEGSLVAVDVVRSKSRKLSIGCQEFTGKNRERIINWAKATA